MSQLFSHVRLFATPSWTIAHQAPPAMEFPRQEYCSGLPFPSPWIYLPDPGIEPRSPALQADSNRMSLLREELLNIPLQDVSPGKCLHSVAIIHCARSQSTLVGTALSLPHSWNRPFSLTGTLTVGPGVSQALWLQNCRCSCV